MSVNLFLIIYRFGGENFLKRFEGKKIMFVGDSVGYNQWLSLVCMLNAAVPQPKHALHTKGDLSTLTFPVNENVMGLIWYLCH